MEWVLEKKLKKSQAFRCWLFISLFWFYFEEDGKRINCLCRRLHQVLYFLQDFSILASSSWNAVVFLNNHKIHVLHLPLCTCGIWILCSSREGNKKVPQLSYLTKNSECLIFESSTELCFGVQTFSFKKMHQTLEIFMSSWYVKLILSSDIKEYLGLILKNYWWPRNVQIL